MIERCPPRFGRGWVRLMSLAGVALVLLVGVHLPNIDEPERAGRSIPSPAGPGDTSNFKIINKEQHIDIADFDQKDSPLWPLVEELRRAGLQSGSATVEPE